MKIDFQLPMRLYHDDWTPPLAIGGVGGSGTRVVAAAAIALGFDMGRDLNAPLDNLAFTLLFKEPHAPDLPPHAFLERARLFARAMAGEGPLDVPAERLLLHLAMRDRGGEDRVQHTAEWLAERARRLIDSASVPRPPGVRWGWKEPNTHIVLPQLLEAYPGMRYVHVVRNGLDMAYSKNRNQLMLWGRHLLGRPVRNEPGDALAYWCEVHRRIERIGEAMGPRFLWLDYDALCADPAAGMARLVSFLGMRDDSVSDLLPLVRPQPTSGRHRLHALDGFAAEDMAYLRTIGHLQEREA